MGRSSISAVVFVVSLVGTTIACAIIWEVFIHPNVYDCTDPGFIDYLTPGDWVHEAGGRPVAVVRDVVHARSMSEPDTIKQGWSIVRLWHLWYALVSASVLISLMFALLPWQRLPCPGSAMPKPPPQAMRPKRTILWIGAVFAVVVGLPLGYYHWILDWNSRPFCHKQFMLAFSTWMLDNRMDINSGKNPFPNVNGLSKESLSTIQENMGSFTGWTNGYRYVPGLREDDAGELVLMYLDRPTRWTWHGAPPTIFNKKAWIVVPVDFTMGSRRQSGSGELSERIPMDEFRRRLKRTIDFVRTNERPNWQTVVAEHTKFLDSIEHVGR